MRAEIYSAIVNTRNSIFPFEDIWINVMGFDMEKKEGDAHEIHFFE